MDIIDINALFGAYPSRHPDSTAEALAGIVETQQVTRCLALATAGLFYSDNAGNTETLAACRTYGSFVPVGTLNPSGYWGQAGRVEEVASAFQMVRFFPCVQGWPVAFAPFGDILDILARGPRTPIMLDVDAPGDVTQLLRIAGDYPHPVILEGVSGRTLTEAIAALRQSPQFYIETHALQVPDGLRLLGETVDIGRVLFGSAAPGLSLGAALRYVRGARLSDVDTTAVLSGNARALWPGLGE